MHITFNPESINWNSFIESTSAPEFSGDSTNTEIGAFQYGFGSSSDYAIFHGLPYQRGAGIGSIFRSLLRYILPVGKQVGKVIGREGIETSQRILNNVLKGANVKETILTEGRDGLKNIVNSAAEKLVRQSGEGGMGKYKKNSRTHKLPPIPKGRNLRTIIPPPSLNINSLLQNEPGPISKTKTKSKRKKVDSLGFY